MKKIFVFLVLSFSITFLFAQSESKRPVPRYDLKINAGPAFTLVPDYETWIFFSPYGIVVPAVYHPGNTLVLTESKCQTTAKTLTGWFAEAELIHRMPRNYAFSFGFGFRKLHFDTETTFFDPALSENPVNLDDFQSEFGETTLQYFTLSPFNLSKSFINQKLTIQVGPAFNFLLKEKFNSLLFMYDDIDKPVPDKPDQLIFGNIVKAEELMVGCNVAVSYRIIECVELRLATQLLNSSIYDEEGLGYYMNKPVDKVKPTLIQFGVSFLPLHLKK